jgi:tetratricopeptide (TPR) repeat protein
VARNADADAFITGTLLRVGPSQLRLDVRVQDTQSGQILFSDKVEAPDVQGIFSMVDAVTGRIEQRLAPAANPAENAPTIEEAATSNLEAFRHYQLGVDFARRFLIAEAVQEMEEAVRLDPQFALAYLRLTGGYNFMGDLRKSQELWPKIDQLQSRLPRKELLEYQAGKAVQSGNLAGGRQILESLLKEFPRDDNARMQLAQSFYNVGQIDSCIALLKEGLGLDSRNDLFLNFLGYAQGAAGNLPAALAANDQYLALRPNDPNPWDTRGDILYQSNHDDEAVTAYRKVISLKPDFSSFVDYAKLAIIYAGQQKYALADSALEEYRRRVTGTAKLYVPVFAGQFQEARGDLEGARESYRQAVRDLAAAGQNAAAAGVLESPTMISLVTREGADADIAFARQQKLDAYESGVISFLLATQGNAADAAKHLRLYIAARRDLGPQGIEQLTDLEALYSGYVRNDAAATLAVASRVPDFISSRYRYPRGWAYFETKDYARAEQDLRAAIMSEKRMSDFNTIRSHCPVLAALAHFYLGQVYEATGKRDQAANEYQEFLSHFENSHASLPQIPIARAALQRFVR